MWNIPTPSVTKEMQIKTTVENHTTRATQQDYSSQLKIERIHYLWTKNGHINFAIVMWWTIM